MNDVFKRSVLAYVIVANDAHDEVGIKTIKSILSSEERLRIITPLLIE